MNKINLCQKFLMCCKQSQCQNQNPACNVNVKSRSTPVGGPVKSGQKRTRAEGQRFGQRLAWAGVATNWIQRQGQRALIPCIGSGQVEMETETDKGTGVVT